MSFVAAPQRSTEVRINLVASNYYEKLNSVCQIEMMIPLTVRLFSLFLSSCSIYRPSEQPAFRINTWAELDAFVALASAHPLMGSHIEDVIVAADQALIDRDCFRRCFSLVPNLVDLTLLITIPDVSNSLDGIILPSLRYLQTNVHHESLTAFLTLNSRVSILVVAACGFDGVCPLAATPLCFVKSLTGPANCVRRIARPGLTRLYMELEENNETSLFADNAPSTCGVLRAIGIRFSRLHYLTAEVFADEFDILCVVGEYCPTLKKLKLTEKSSTMVSRFSVQHTVYV